MRSVGSNQTPRREIRTLHRQNGIRDASYELLDACRAPGYGTLTAIDRVRRAHERPYPVWLALVVVGVFVAPNFAYPIWASSDVSMQVVSPEQLTTSLAFSLVVQVGLFALSLLPVLLSGRLDARLWGNRAGTVHVWRTGVYTGAAAAVGSYTLNAALISLSGSSEPVRQQLLENAQVGGIPLLLVVTIAVIVAPVTEEVVFRGVLFRALTERFGGMIGVVGSAAIFAVIHIEVLTSQPLALAGIAVVGAVLAESYRRTGDLLVPMLGHAIFNATSLGLSVFLGTLPTAA